MHSKWHQRPVTVLPATRNSLCGQLLHCMDRPSAHIVSHLPYFLFLLGLNTTSRGLNRSRTGITPELLIKSEKLTHCFHNKAAEEFSLNKKTWPVSHFLREKSSDETQALFHIICSLPLDAQPSAHLYLEVAIERGTINTQWEFSSPMR